MLMHYGSASENCNMHRSFRKMSTNIIT